nr:hypothetical protein BaRGS_026840 [Batillaria attramentaria]
MTDSIYSSAADSDLELAEEAILEDDDSYEDIDVPQTSPGVDEEHPQVTSSHGGDLSWEPRPYDLETELDWLCEPEWNNLEMELFWHVLRPHVESLLQPQHTAYLPEPCVPIRNMDAGDCKMLDK